MFHMKQTWTWSGSWMWTWKLCLNHIEKPRINSARSTKRRIALQARSPYRRDTLYAPKILRRVSPITTGKYHTTTVFKDSIQGGCFSFWLFVGCIGAFVGTSSASSACVWSSCSISEKDNVWNQFYSFYTKRTLCFDTLKLPTRYFICVAQFLAKKCVLQRK